VICFGRTQTRLLLLHAGVVLDSYEDEALGTAGDLRELAAAATHGRGRGACGRARLSGFVTYDHTLYHFPTQFPC